MIDPKQPISVSQEIIHYTDRRVGFDTMFPLFRLCCTWMAPASQGPLGEMVRALGQFLLSEHSISTMFLRGREFVIDPHSRISYYQFFTIIICSQHQWFIN